MKDLDGWKKHAIKRGFSVVRLRRPSFTHQAYLARYHGKTVGRFTEEFGGSLMSRADADKTIAAFARKLRGNKPVAIGKH